MSEQPAGTDIVFARASLRDRMNWAHAIAQAGDLVPKGFRNEDGSPNAAKVLLAAEYATMLGEHPLVGLTSINVIEGKPTPSPALMGALIRKRGHKLRVQATGSVEAGDYSVTATLVRADDPDVPFTATWTPHRGARAGLCKYTQDAKTGLWHVEARSKYGKVLPWESYTEALCKARAISEVARDGAEDVLLGAHYTPEEIGAVVNEAGEVVREDLIEDAELVDADGNPESDRNPGHNENAKARLRDPGATGPVGDATPPLDGRLRPSRTVENSGPGRPSAPSDDEHAVADEWADRARKAITVTDARDLYRDANHRGILGYALTSGELLGDVLRARGEHLADEEAHAAEADVPLEIPVDDGYPDPVY